MCGIFSIYSKNKIFSEETLALIVESFKKISHRGPDAYNLVSINNCLIGFHRLSINDTSSLGMQPFTLNNNFVTCNGEIYNYHSLLDKIDQSLLKSRSDCEILPHLFEKYGFEDAIEMLDAVFAISYVTKDYIKISRDKIGVKPVFYAENESFFVVSSEAKALDGLFENINQLLPGSILTYSFLDNSSSMKTYWNIYDNVKKEEKDYKECVKDVHDLLVKSVQKRMTSDREIGCLLSGGLDSSIVASILSKEMKKNGKKLHTFSVGFPDSTDIVYARKVSEFIGSEHHELIISYQDALEKLETIVKMIETYDTTTIRASTPMFMLCEWISKNFPEKVIFSGEGSDELFCGYLYFHNAPNAEEAFNDSLRLMSNLYKYDVLRADRCTAGNGLEFREPFLDHELISYVINMNSEYNKPKEYEKTILRHAFESYIPESVVWRRKAAFSDAVSSSHKPWYMWIQEYVQGKEITDFGGSQENNYYRTLFYKNFKNYRPVVNLWLPKWNDVGDEPSATVLKVYNKSEHK